ncbi:MAG TPA: HAMP domain-containing protein, partial [Planctomycetaceae bacterium]|nr:HAMP domain-containing protein [Planctomycetaceae bacterium]
MVSGTDPLEEAGNDGRTTVTKSLHDEATGKCLFCVWLRPERASLLERLGWSVLAVYDQDKVIAPLSHSRSFVSLALAGASLFGLIIAAFGAWDVSRRIKELALAAEQIGQGNTDVTITPRGHDELTVLARGFTTMAARLREAAKQRDELNALLRESAHQAGAAEIANGVLHNVGNVLNSIQVSANIVAETLKTAPVPKLAKAADLLKQNMDRLAEFLTTDPRGQKLPEYICLVADQLKRRCAEVATELNALLESVEHAKAVICAQQSYSKLAGLTEKVKLSELVEDALRLNAASFLRHNIQVVRDYTHDCEVLTERHKVLQILVNLISNAKQALYAVDRPDRRIELKTYRHG